jgi:hypothetical protein
LHRRECARLAAELDFRLQDKLVSRWQAQLSNGLYEKILNSLVAREISPQEAVQRLLDEKEGK